MISRRLGQVIPRYARDYPVVAIVGPRQSGKTTLARSLFPDYPYYTLESLDHRNRALSDPRGFLSDIGPRAILDEVQRAPELFSYLQEYVDASPKERHYVLTGSHQFLLMESISQSLAGRIVTFRLYPFTLDELYPDTAPPDTYSALLRGWYPRIHDQDLESTTWYAGYVETYLERDVRQVVNVADIRQFETFLKVIAGNSAQILNKASVANRVGISEPTVQRWLSVLESSGVIALLPPYYRNYSKRLLKSPKIVVLDSGLLCYLLGIHSAEVLQSHPLYGAVFESFVAAELAKRIAHTASRAGLYFWRDKTGHEVDLLVEDGADVLPIEIKAAATYHPDFAKQLSWWLDLPENNASRGLVVYNGDQTVNAAGPIPCVPWQDLNLYSSA
jgi:uncharacterized protein